MEYIIKSNSYRLMKEKIIDILKDINEENINYFDLLDDSIDDVIEECNYVSLFNEKKAVIVYNANIFGTKYEYKEVLEKLEKYLNNPNELTTLIFITDGISLKKKCVKIIKENNNLIEISDLKDSSLEIKIKNYLKENKLDIETFALKTLIKNLNNNLDFILNELDKLIVVKDNNFITEEDIDKYTLKLPNDNIFDFVDVIIKKDKIKIFGFLKKFIKEHQEPSIIFANIAMQYRLIYCSIGLKKEGHSEKDIATLLDVHPYRVKLALDNSKYYSKIELEEKLLKICTLDEQIKTGKIDNYIALKMFLVNL